MESFEPELALQSSKPVSAEPDTRARQTLMKRQLSQFAAASK